MVVFGGFGEGEVAHAGGMIFVNTVMVGAGVSLCGCGFDVGV